MLLPSLDDRDKPLRNNLFDVRKSLFETTMNEKQMTFIGPATVLFTGAPLYPDYWHNHAPWME